ncbi:MAG: HD-GYP domain-containing protein [Candidatus Omnitrophica bacterium]|nr:HD-GYP domain-containing protein [Candidatus Omnitrophota bacterium]MDE2008767.1 HD-GYP domain-containing protein [Candidatus Omnitrophota bacterium]
MPPTKIDYKRELESASKGMVLIHDHRLLIKLIVRSLVQKVRIQHAGMILYNPDRDSYVLSISRGGIGERIPEGLIRFNKTNPLIKLFIQKEYKYIFENRNAIVAEDINKLLWKESVISNGNGTKQLLHNVSEQLPKLNAVACVPAYYQHMLMAILLLGEKQDGARFDQEELNFFSALASDVAIAIRNAQLFEGLKKEAERNRNLFIQTTIALGSAIEAKDIYTHGHTERVTKYALAIGRRMEAAKSYVFPYKFFENLYISGLLHDIGKIGVPEAILSKQDKLTAEEYEIMKSHTTRGAEILSSLTGFEEVINGVQYHHERYDGQGYPDGLKGEDIPMIAAIIAVADTFDAMTTDRPYRKGLSKDEAIIEIQQCVNKQFHHKPVEALVELYNKGEI